MEKSEISHPDVPTVSWQCAVQGNGNQLLYTSWAESYAAFFVGFTGNTPPPQPGRTVSFTLWCGSEPGLFFDTFTGLYETECSVLPVNNGTCDDLGRCKYVTNDSNDEVCQPAARDTLPACSTFHGDQTGCTSAPHQDYCTYNTVTDECFYRTGSCSSLVEKCDYSHYTATFIPIEENPCAAEQCSSMRPGFLSEQPVCTTQTGYNPELTGTRLPCGENACAENEHCEQASLGTLREFAPTCVCNDPALFRLHHGVKEAFQSEPFRCANEDMLYDDDDDVADLGMGLPVVQGTFSGDLPSLLDVRSSVVDAELVHTSNSSFNYAHGTASGCLDEARSVSFSVEFTHYGGINIEVDLVANFTAGPTGYDGSALWFAPPYGTDTVRGRLARPVTDAERVAFSAGKMLLLEYEMFPLLWLDPFLPELNNLQDGYEARLQPGPRLMVSPDPCLAFSTAEARCRVVPGCAYCHSLAQCYTPGQSALPTLYNDTDMCEWDNIADYDYYEEMEVPYQPRPCPGRVHRLVTTSLPGHSEYPHAPNLCIAIQKGSDGDSILVAFATNRSGFTDQAGELAGYCDGWDTVSTLEAPTSTCTGGVDISLRDEYTRREEPPYQFDDTLPMTPPPRVQAFTAGQLLCAKGSCIVDYDTRECQECPCFALSSNRNCQLDDGTGVSEWGERGCFDAAWGGDGPASQSFCAQNVEPASSVGIAPLRFCGTDTSLLSCNFVASNLGGSQYSTSQGCDAVAGEPCQLLPEDDVLSCNDEDPRVLDAFCEQPIVLLVTRVAEYLPLFGEPGEISGDEELIPAYVSFERIPSFGRIVPYSECVDAACAVSDDEQDKSSCISDEPAEEGGAMVAGTPAEGNWTVDCLNGVPAYVVPLGQPVYQHDWTFVIEKEALEEGPLESEMLLYSVNGTLFGLEIEVGEVDFSSSIPKRQFENDQAPVSEAKSVNEPTGNELLIAAIVGVLALVCAVGICLAADKRRRAALAAEEAVRAHAKEQSKTQGDVEMAGMATAASTASAGTLATGGASTTGTASSGAGDVINVTDPGSSLDAKYIIRPQDLHKGKKIGEGGYGYVYRGEWRDMEVAVKEVRGTDKEVVDMLMLEARAAIDLRPHENIVTLYGVCLQPFSIVTAFCSKGSLDDMLYGDSPVSFSDVELKKLCVGIASGISHLHHEGIIHRDLAARNILVNETGTPMVADFGMSRKDENALEGTENQTKTTVGPIRWMAPEQLDSQTYSAFSDVWSFGVILYEIFARQVPWKKYSNMKAAQLVLNEHHLAEEKYRPAEMNPCALKVMRACFAYEARNRPKMSWSVKKMNRDWDEAGGGEGYRRAEVQPTKEEDAGVYAAPPTRAQLKKMAPVASKSDTRRSPRHRSRSGSSAADEVYVIPAAVASKAGGSKVRRRSSRRRSVGATEDVGYDAPPTGMEPGLEEAEQEDDGVYSAPGVVAEEGGLYEAPKSLVEPVAEEAASVYEAPKMAAEPVVEEAAGVREEPAAEEAGRTYEAPVLA